jgi:hypothetical protein
MTTRLPRRLAQAPQGAERLGLPTIMDRALAAKHGVRYVHLAAFAIDIDRVREASESQRDERPFGWEVFLTECFLLETIDPASEGDAALLEDALLSVLELREGEEVLGTQLPFAVWHAVEKRGWPTDLSRALRHWKAKPEQLGKDLDGFFLEHLSARKALAEGCLSLELAPPLAPPTQEILSRWAGRAVGGPEGESDDGGESAHR